MRKKFLYFVITVALVGVVPSSFVYAADIDGAESQATEGLQVTVTDSLGDAQQEESQKEELALEGDVSIDGLINTIHEGFPEVIEEDQIIIDVAVGTEIELEMLPSRVTVSLVYTSEMGEDGNISAKPTADFTIIWDLTKLEGKAQSEGTFFLTGEWGECEQNITGGAIDLETFKPVCKITAEEIKIVQLPTAAFFYKTELNQGSPYTIHVSKSGRRVMIILNQKRVYGTEFSIDVVDVATKEPVLVKEGMEYNVSVLWYNVGMLNLQGFFEDGKIYEITLNQKNGDTVYRSNTMLLDITQEDLPTTTLPPEGGDNSSNDDSIDVPRDGSGRNTQDNSKDEKKLSVSNLNTLLKSDKTEAIVILDAGKISLSRGMIEDWAKDKISVTLDLKKTKENSFSFQVLENGKKITKLGHSVKISIPMGEKNSLTKDLTSEQRKNLLIAKINGIIIPTAYFDTKSNEMIINTVNTGNITIEKGQSITFKDINNHWSKPAVDFASGRGIAKGYEDQTFRPDEMIKGSEFTDFLMRNLPEGMINEKQKSQMEKYYNAEQYITREIAAVAIYSVLNEHLDETYAKINFTDLKLQPSETKKAIQAVQQAGIMQGRGNNKFAAKETMSRSESLTMLINIMKLL